MNRANKQSLKSDQSRRRRAKRGRGRRRGGRISYVKAASQVASDVRWLMSVVNVEEKYLDAQASPTPSTTASLTLLNGLSLGTTSTSRNGQSIKMTHVTANFLVTNNATAVNTNTRIVMLIDKQANAAAITAADIFLSTSSFMSLYLVSVQNRIRVLFDQFVSLSTAGPSNVTFTKQLTLNHHTEYNTNNNGNITDIVSGALYLFLMSDQATNTPSMAYQIRLQFVDN